MKDTSVIPKGFYCYENIGDDGKGGMKIKICPYWSSVDGERPKQESGFCSFLGYGDWENPSGMGLLWDQVKECGINMPTPEELEAEEDAARGEAGR